MRQLALFDSPKTPRAIARRLCERSDGRPRLLRNIDSPRGNLTPKIDPGVTLNPFTPANRNSLKRTRVSMRATATSRYKTEFIELNRLGQGQFGSVFKAVNRFDGCVYAIKKMKKTQKGANEESASLREVCAHAVLGKHEHVVRYYSAWCEQDRMVIQTGTCPEILN
jgi:wee1-like protein kinase